MCIEVSVNENDIYIQVDESFTEIGGEGEIDKLIGMLLLAKIKQLEARRKVLYEKGKGNFKKRTKKKDGCFYTKADLDLLCKYNSNNEID